MLTLPSFHALSQKLKHDAKSAEAHSLKFELERAHQSLESFEQQESEVLERYEALESTLTATESELQDFKCRVLDVEEAALKQVRSRECRRI
jgi:predicted  nucleic acid-binding Zn-ribbon protein